MKKMILFFIVAIGLFLSAFNHFASAETIDFSSDGKMFAPNCFCKEDVHAYNLAPWCGSKDTCNGSSDTHSANVSEGDYDVSVKLGGLTDYQRYEEVILTFNGNSYSIPDLGGNSSSTGTAEYSLGKIHLSGNISAKASHRYENTLTGKWYSDEATRIGGSPESVDIQSIELKKAENPPAAINGSCGSRSAFYRSSDTNWLSNTNFCNVGSVHPTTPSFPSQGETVSWSCHGTNGGKNADCQAKRKPAEAIPSPEPEPEPEHESDEKDCRGEIGNYVWLDSDGDGQQDDNEKGLDDISIKLTFKNKTYRTKTNDKGRYSFEDLCKGDYTVSVKDEDVSGYTQTYDPDNKKNNKTDVELKDDNDSDTKADFGYRGKRSAPVTGSGSMAIYVSILLTLIILIAYKKIKNKKLAFQK